MTVIEWINQQDDREKWLRIFAIIKRQWEQAHRADSTITFEEFGKQFLEYVEAYAAQKQGRES